MTTQTREEADRERAKADMDKIIYGNGYLKVLSDGTVKHIPAEQAHFKPPPSEEEHLER